MTAFVTPSVPIVRHRHRNGLVSTSACRTRPRNRVSASATPVPAKPEKEDVRTPLYEMRGITFRIPMDFDVILFNNMNFQIYPGEFVVMIGGNGAGKSTGMSPLQCLPYRIAIQRECLSFCQLI